MVERYYVRKLENECAAQRMRQKRMIYQAHKNPDSEARERAIKYALGLKLPSCKELNDFTEYIS